MGVRERGRRGVRMEQNNKTKEDTNSTDLDKYEDIRKIFTVYKTNCRVKGNKYGNKKSKGNKVKESINSFKLKEKKRKKNKYYKRNKVHKKKESPKSKKCEKIWKGPS